MGIKVRARMNDALRLLSGRTSREKHLGLSKLRSLGRSALKALPAVLRALYSDDDEVRDLAAAVIEDIGPSARKAIPIIVRALRRKPRYSLGEALAGIGLPAVPVLGRLTADRDQRVRRIACWALTHTKLGRKLGRPRRGR
jgi:HEAT repeat protein